MKNKIKILDILPQDQEVSGEVRLVLEVIQSALLDNDEEFINSQYLDLWCNLINLNPEYVREKAIRGL